MSAPVLQVRVPEDTIARIDEARGDDTRSAWLQRLIDRELTGQTATPAPAAPSLAVIADGEPSGGAICMGPDAGNATRPNTASRKLPLCPACHAALEGDVHQREIPPSAARIMRRGAA